MLCICGYGSLMNIKSFYKTLSLSKENISSLFIPVVLKNVVYSNQDGVETRFYAKRVYSQPRIKWELTHDQLKANQRSVLTLEFTKEKPKIIPNFFNGVIGINISERQFDLLKEREIGYDLFPIKKKDLDFPYHDGNKLFLQEFVKAFPEKMNLIITELTDQVNIEDSEILKLIQKETAYSKIKFFFNLILHSF